MTKIRLHMAWMLAVGFAAVLAGPLQLLAEEEIAVEEEAVVAAPDSVPSAKPALKKAVKKPGVAAIRRVTVIPVGERIEIRVEGQGSLKARIMTIDAENKLVLDFPGAIYSARGIVLGEPGLGDIRRVRGAQNKPLPAPMARVVIELNKMVPYTESSKTGRYVISLATRGEAGPDDEMSSAAPVPVAPAATPSAPASPEAVPTETPSPVPGGADEATAGRSSVLHAMATDLPDRVRLVVTADGVIKYKLASQDGGKELQLRLFDMDLKWSPPRLVLKDGPITEVRAEALRKPAAEVRMSIRLREPRPYHVRRDQNQVIVEIEKPAEAEQVGELTTKGDLAHRVTLNVQNEDLSSLVKAMAFEAGFDNVVLNTSASKATDTVTISLKDVPFAKALNLILSSKEFIWKVERGVLRVGKEAEFDAELEASALSGGATSDSSGDEEGGIATRVFRLKYISVFDLAGSGVETGLDISGALTESTFKPAAVVKSDVVKILTDLLVSKKKGKVVIDARSNSIIVTDASSNMAKISRIIRELDVQVPQVHIAARLIQVTHKDADKLGINWTMESSAGSNPAVNILSQGASLGGAYQLTTGVLGQGFNLSGLLDALQAKGEVRTLLNPSITTLHDRASVVTSIEQFSYTELSSDYTGGSRVDRGIARFVDVPITLVVRPHVNTDKTIVLEVMINMTTVTGRDPGLPPNTSSQRAATRLLVRNRETGVIGGMLSDVKTKNVRKVPILGSLPWFLGGALFRNEDTSSVKMELILFLTPAIAEEL
jgi:hypothetical protein